MAEKGKNTLDSHASDHIPIPAQPQKVVTAGDVGSSTSYLTKKRRGRRRKSDALGNSVVPPLMIVVASLPWVTVVASPPLMYAPPMSQVVSGTPVGFTFSADDSANRTLGRGCGRPQAFENWQAIASIG